MSTIPENPYMSSEQVARAEALAVVRDILANTEDVGVIDLVTLAQWVMDGKDPYPLPTWQLSQPIEAVTSYTNDDIQGEVLADLRKRVADRPGTRLETLMMLDKVMEEMTS